MKASLCVYFCVCTACVFPCMPEVDSWSPLYYYYSDRVLLNPELTDLVRLAGQQATGGGPVDRRKLRGSCQLGLGGWAPTLVL